MNNKNPHNNLFVVTFSKKSEAKIYIKDVLPAKILKNLDFRTLKLENTSYVDENLAEYFSDMVYSIRWLKTTITITFLLEHKSYLPKEPVYLQLLRYLIEAYYYQYKQADSNNKKLTVVIPIVLYHGKDTWIKRSFDAYFDLPDDDLKRFIPNFDFLLDDLSKRSDEEIMQLQISYLLSTLLVFKHKQDAEYIRQNSKKIFTFVNRGEINEETKSFFKSFILYIYQTFSLDKSDIDSIFQELPKYTQNMVQTTYDRLIEEGKIIGFQKGQEIGLQKGQEIGLQKGQEIGLQKGEINAKTAIVNQFVLEFPLVSNEKIASIAQVSVDFVANIRKELEQQIQYPFLQSLENILQHLLKTPTLTVREIAGKEAVTQRLVKDLKSGFAKGNKEKADKMLKGILNKKKKLSKDEQKKIINLSKKYIKKFQKK